MTTDRDLQALVDNTSDPIAAAVTAAYSPLREHIDALEKRIAEREAELAVRTREVATLLEKNLAQERALAEVRCFSRTQVQGVLLANRLALRQHVSDLIDMLGRKRRARFASEIARIESEVGL